MVNQETEKSIFNHRFMQVKTMCESLCLKDMKYITKQIFHSTTQLVMQSQSM